MVEEAKREEEDEEQAKEQIMKHVGVTRRKLFACLHSRSAYLRTVMQEDNLEWCLNALTSTISQSSDLEFGPCFSCFLSRHPNTEDEEMFQPTGVDSRARSVRNIYRF
jgi:hypothetical protein